MKQVIYKIKRNDNIARMTFLMKLEGDTSEIKNPGTFVNIKISGKFLRRPISVCSVEENELTIVYKVVGEGTEIMSQMKAGRELDCLVGLGNGYDLSCSGDKPLLVGGGVGVPPMYELCKRLTSEGRDVTVVCGFNDKSEVFFEDEFRALGAKLYVCTANGSHGVKGFVTDVMQNLEYTHFYTCGPMPMFRAINKIAKTEGQYSFEEKMGCGFGACMGCSCKTLTGNKRICKEGPVLFGGEIIWEN